MGVKDLWKLPMGLRNSRPISTLLPQGEDFYGGDPVFHGRRSGRRIGEVRTGLGRREEYRSSAGEEEHPGNVMKGKDYGRADAASHPSP